MPPKSKPAAQGNAAPDNNAGSSDTVKTYTVVNAVTHDQESYATGDPIELDDKTAAPLLKVGAIAIPDADEAAT